MPEIKTYAVDNLTWSDASLWQQFADCHHAQPDALAVVEGDGRCWTRAELHRLALAISQTLQEKGVKAHDRVLLEGRKNAQTVAAALAISSVGAVVCPISPDLGRAERQILEERLGHVALIGAAAENAEPLRETQNLHLSTRPRPEPSTGDEAERAVALIGFTSGTTGVPKGVMHASAAMNYAARACGQIAGLAAGDAIVSMTPWGSAPGFTFSLHFALSQGYPLIIIDHWEPLQALTMMDQYACRWGMCVPTHLVAMLECVRSGAWTKRSPLKALAVGGSNMSPELIADAERLLGIMALRMFGMSECMGHASTRPDDSLERRQHTDGRPFPGTEDEAFDNEMKMLPRGERGQAGVRGPSLFLGYFKGLGGEATQLTPDGFYLSGDEIIRGQDGYLKVVGRLKDQIIRGGYNIDPAEVEAALLRHPAIAKAAVVAVPHPRLGEQACAICCFRSSHPPLELTDLIAHVESIGLSKKKWPEHLVVIEDMMYTSTGKIDKKVLRKKALEMLGLGS
ncbi:MAG: acyl--CoA ligase [Azonexus sp.]|nr:acyl--CoA ligase [Azonexus sp.]